MLRKSSFQLSTAVVPLPAPKIPSRELMLAIVPEATKLMLEALEPPLQSRHSLLPNWR
jgi:hypothetical protein